MSIKTAEKKSAELYRRAEELHKEAGQLEYQAEQVLLEAEEMADIASSDIDVGMCIHYLEGYGSAQDPIKYKGKECVPEDLQYDIFVDGSPSGIDSFTKARDVRISYWGWKDGQSRSSWIHGTLRGMLMNRIQDPEIERIP